MYASGVPLASLWRPTWAPRLCASISRGRRGTCCSARGVMYASGVPLASLWRPTWAPRLCASISRGRRGTCCSARGVMYASGVPLASHLGSAPLRVYFAWPARHLLLRKGRDVRFWRPSRGRRGTCCSARGVIYVWRPTPLASLWRPSGVPPGLRASVLLFRVAGAALAALQGA